MVARIDKTDSAIGVFRAKLGFAPVSGDVGAIFGVGLNSSGRIVKGGGQTGIVGVLCLSSLLAQGDVADVLTNGEIVDLALTAATVYYGDTATGAISTTATANKRVGWTVETWRLVVRIGNGAAGG